VIAIANNIKVFDLLNRMEDPHWEPINWEEYEEDIELLEPEDYVDQFYHTDASMMDQEDLEGMEGGLSPFTVAEILHHCIEPTLMDGVKHTGKIIIWCVIFRITTQITTSTPAWIKHGLSIVSGCLLAGQFFNTGVFYLLGLVTLGYLALITSHLSVGRGRGVAAAMVAVAYNIGCEMWVVDPVMWHQVRGAIMICAMKIISVGFDMDAYVDKAEEKEHEEILNLIQDEKKNEGKTRDRSNKRNKKDTENKVKENETKSDVDELNDVPGWFEYAGYCLCPASVVLGPWVSITEYREIFRNPRWNLTWIIKIVFTVSFAFMFLTISTCWNPWLIPDHSWRWWLAYRDAMSFRASHYFVSFMSEASAVAAGFGCHQVGGQGLWYLTVTQPHNIEVPRSLVEVVVSWNLPMHRWLKLYVFKTARSSLGPGPAIVATYFASTLLHGLSGQLAAVLLSLGLYTWVEHSFRQKLADIMDASLGARRDQTNKYKHREGSAWVILVNMLFGLLAMFHLAYLGVMFDQSEESQSGYSWQHTLDKWRKLDFTSHYIVLGMVMVNYLL